MKAPRVVSAPLSRRAALTLLGTGLLGGRLAPAAVPELPQGITADGHHFLGRADAPVTLIEYGDFL